VYVRLGRSPVPDLYADGDEGFLPGGGRVLREGTEVTVCCCGIMVSEALRAAEVLARQNISAEVIDCYSVSPLPAQSILDSVHRTGCCVTAEEHFARGGLGEGVAALVSGAYPVPVKQVAVFDKFGQSGSPAELQEYYGCRLPVVFFRCLPSPCAAVSVMVPDRSAAGEFCPASCSAGLDHAQEVRNGIRLAGVTKVFEPDIVALEDIYLSIDKGEFVYLVGTTGS
jgi:ABC-type multidrug transport system fused ATPase/permease subunit